MGRAVKLSKRPMKSEENIRNGYQKWILLISKLWWKCEII